VHADAALPVQPMGAAARAVARPKLLLVEASDELEQTRLGGRDVRRQLDDLLGERLRAQRLGLGIAGRPRHRARSSGHFPPRYIPELNNSIMHGKGMEIKWILASIPPRLVAAPKPANASP